MIEQILNSTIIINGKKVSFKNQIRNVEEVMGIAIVVLENATTGKVSEQPKNNIYAIDSNAQIIWNIKDILPEDIFYPGIKIDGDKLIAIDVIGVHHKIDVRNKIELYSEGIR